MPAFTLVLESRQQLYTLDLAVCEVMSSPFTVRAGAPCPDVDLRTIDRAAELAGQVGQRRWMGICSQAERIHAVPVENGESTHEPTLARRQKPERRHDLERERRLTHAVRDGGDELGRAADASPAPHAGATRERPRALPAGQLATARIVSLEGERAVVSVGWVEADATWDASVDRLVLEGARARGERVLVEQTEDGSLLILGALRTRPTPGIDAAESYEIDADRIAIRAGSELSLTARVAGVVLRAAGEVETYADRILSRAESVHKIVGRVLRLN